MKELYYECTYMIHKNKLFFQVKDYTAKAYYTSISMVSKQKKLIKALTTKYTISYNKTVRNTLYVSINNIYQIELLDNKSSYFCNDMVKENNMYAIKYIINYNYIIIQVVDIKTYKCYSVEINYINIAHLNDILYQLNNLPNSKGIIMDNNNMIMLNMNTNNAEQIHFNNLLTNKYLIKWYQMAYPKKKEIKNTPLPEYNPSNDINYIFDFNLS